MVTPAKLSFAMGFWAQAQQSVWLQMTPQDRVRVLAALAALILLGCAMIAFVWWGARLTRRYMQRPPRAQLHQPKSRPRVDDWADKPLIPHDDE